MKDFLWTVLRMYFPSFNLSCGVNLQQNGYKEHSTLLMILGITLIATAMAQLERLAKERKP